MRERMRRAAALLCAVVMALALWPVGTWAEENTLCRGWFDPVTHEQHSEEVSPSEAEALYSAMPTNGSDIALYNDEDTVSGDAGDSPTITVDPFFEYIDTDLPRYGESMLAKEENSAELLDVYASLFLVAACGFIDCPLDTPVSIDTFRYASLTFSRDYPELFWADAVYYYYKDNPSACVAVGLRNNSLVTDLDDQKSSFLSSANSILNGMPRGSDFDKELYLHDALIDHIVYDLSTLEDQSAYGALVNGKAVCAGYARAFQYLLMRAGIQSYYVVGESQEQAHGWNMVKIDEEWYYVDPTWDDPTGATDSPHYGYLNITTDMLLEDHSLYTAPENVPLPICTSHNAFYHKVKGTMVSTTDNDLVEKVAYLMRCNNGKARLYITDNDPVNTAANWYRNNYSTIYNTLGATGSASFGYSAVGREVTLIFEGTFDPLPVGELNGQGGTDSTDLQLLYTYLTSGEVPAAQTRLSPAIFQQAADVNRDGQVDVYDLQMLYEIVCQIA